MTTLELFPPTDLQPTESQLMSSAEGSRVRTSAPQATAMDCRESGRDSGESIPAWLARFDRSSLSWRTSQRCFLEGWATFSETWPRSGMTRNGTAFQLPTLAPLIDGIGFGWWPTPTASDAKRCSELKLVSLAKRAAKPGAHWNFAEHVSAELEGYPHPEFVELLMGFPLGWTDCER